MLLSWMLKFWVGLKSAMVIPRSSSSERHSADKHTSTISEWTEAWMNDEFRMILTCDTSDGSFWGRLSGLAEDWQSGMVQVAPLGDDIYPTVNSRSRGFSLTMKYEYCCWPKTQRWNRQMHLHQLIIHQSAVECTFVYMCWIPVAEAIWQKSIQAVWCRD